MEHGKQKAAGEHLMSSGATFHSAFILTSLPPHDVSVVSSRQETYSPSFSVKGSDLIDLASDGKTNLLPESKTSVINLIHSTLFKTMDVWINNVLISVPTGNYDFTAFINRIINSTQADSETKLVCEGYAQSTSKEPLS